MNRRRRVFFELDGRPGQHAAADETAAHHWIVTTGAAFGRRFRFVEVRPIETMIDALTARTDPNVTLPVPSWGGRRGPKG